MKTSPTENGGRGMTLLVSLDEAGKPGRWRLVDERGVVDRGDSIEAIAADRAARVVLEVPGDAVAVHWLDLAEGLAPAQAAAAARLLLADASAEPLSQMHVAVGRAEAGLTPAVLVPAERMAEWLDFGLEPDVIVPAPLLLPAPESGFRRRDRDYRGAAVAFTMEPELAEHLIAGAETQPVDEARFEAGLPGILAEPPINLRQGPFARRRQWKLEGGGVRRIALLAVALVMLTLIIQVATIVAYTFAADRVEAEASALASETPGAGSIGPGFGPLAAVLFESVRTTPNVELARVEYRVDGSLAATVTLDAPATFSALRSRLEASGLRVEPGEMRTGGGRPMADMTIRPS